LDAKGRRPCSVKIIVAKSKEEKTGRNLAEYSEEAYGSKGAHWLMMVVVVMMIMMMI
jgi:hypothetical protein